jgi:hypothetical protein
LSPYWRTSEGGSELKFVLLLITADNGRGDDKVSLENVNIHHYKEVFIRGGGFGTVHAQNA